MSHSHIAVEKEQKKIFNNITVGAHKMCVPISGTKTTKKG